MKYIVLVVCCTMFVTSAQPQGEGSIDSKPNNASTQDSTAYYISELRHYEELDHLENVYDSLNITKQAAIDSLKN